MRDYKEYPIAKNTKLLGCSVLVFSPETMFTTFGQQECRAEIESLMAKRGLAMFTIVCNVVTGDDQWSKYLLVYTAENQLMTHFCGILRKADQLRLTDEVQCDRAVYWECQNKTVTRKVFE